MSDDILRCSNCDQPALLRPPYEYCGSPLCGACLYEESWQDELALMRMEDRRQREELMLILRVVGRLAYFGLTCGLGYLAAVHLGWFVSLLTFIAGFVGYRLTVRSPPRQLPPTVP